jgi:hypothetical protein
MSALLIAMLRAAGVEGVFALVRTVNIGQFDETFPSLQFNHAIVQAILPTGAVWLDPTCATCPYGELPRVDRGAWALLIEGERGTICQVPPTDHLANRTKTDLAAEFDRDGTLVCSGTIEMRGQPALGARSELIELSPDGRHRWMERYLAYRCPGAIVDEAGLESLSGYAEPLVLNYRFHVPSYSQENGRNVFFSPEVLQQQVVTHHVATDERRYPIWLRYPETLSDRVTLKTPPGWSIYACPEVVSGREAFAEFSCGVTQRGSDVIFTRRIAFLSDRITSEDHPRLRRWLEQLARASRRMVGASIEGD